MRLVGGENYRKLQPADIQRCLWMFSAALDRLWKILADFGSHLNVFGLFVAFRLARTGWVKLSCVLDFGSCCQLFELLLVQQQEWLDLGVLM